MNKLFRQIGLMLILLVAISLGSCTSKYSYETVPNDPLKARIYTLDNGLKVYMTVNKETPRIQTYIAVRVGGKINPGFRPMSPSAPVERTIRQRRPGWPTILST